MDGETSDIKYCINYYLREYIPYFIIIISIAMFAVLYAIYEYVLRTWYSSSM